MKNEVFKTSVAVANQSGAMEADTITKHGRSKSLKSHTNRRKILFKNAIIATIMACTLLTFVQFSGTTRPIRKCETIRFSAFHASVTPRKTTLVESAKDCEYTITWSSDNSALESPFFAYIIYTDVNGKRHEYVSMRNSERIKPKAGTKIETYAHTTLANQRIRCIVCSICTN